MDYTVRPEEDARFLRDILRRSMGVSYSAMKSAKWDRRILLNGEFATVDTRVSDGDIVTFLPKENAPVYQLRPYDLPLNIPYQDEHLMVIDKIAPLASQSSLNHPDDSLENALFAHFGCPSDFLYRPVNRLDKGTSGLMCVALDGHTQHRLQAMLHTPDFRRSYLAVVDGCPMEPEGTIDAPISKEEAASIRRIVTPEGKPSVTHYRVLKTNGQRSLIALELETGRTHQIRVHMAYLGCPVFGDFLYGQESEELPGRFALHSHRVELLHPYTGERLIVESPLPDALQRLVE